MLLLLFSIKNHRGQKLYATHSEAEVLTYQLLQKDLGMLGSLDNSLPKCHSRSSWDTVLKLFSRI